MESAFFPWKKYLGYTLAILAIIFAYTWINSPMIVTVLGVGEVSAPAQSATLTFTQSSTGENSAVASATLNTSINNIKNSLANIGIPNSDVFESQITVVPTSSIVENGTGFTASTAIGIKTIQVNNLESIINNLYSLGVSVVTQPILSVGDVQKLENEAYILALKDAKKKAGSIAFSNLKLIRKIVLIEQSATQPSSTVTTTADTASQIEKNISPDSGLIKIQKSLSVSYKMW